MTTIRFPKRIWCTLYVVAWKFLFSLVWKGNWQGKHSTREYALKTAQRKLVLPIFYRVGSALDLSYQTDWRILLKKCDKQFYLTYIPNRSDAPISAMDMKLWILSQAVNIIILHKVVTNWVTFFFEKSSFFMTFSHFMFQHANTFFGLIIKNA